jgi:hypothetical protein
MNPRPIPHNLAPHLARRDLLLTLLLLGTAPAARALSLDQLTNTDATAGLKAALTRGAELAVGLLGKSDGFWANDLVRIPLPDWLQRAESTLRFMGRGKDVDDLKLGVNRAAEQAVPQAKALLTGAVRNMTVDDAKGILRGGENSVTQFFADKTRVPLFDRFMPIVTQVTDRIGLARNYNKLVGQGENLGLVKSGEARIERHVTGKALDGLYLMIGEEEKKIRRDPVGTGSEILKKVFGGLK